MSTPMNIDINKRIEEILESQGENYFPMHEYPESYMEENKKSIKDHIPEVKQLIRDVIKEATPERQEEYPDDGETTHYNGHYADPYNDFIDELEANVKRLGL